VADEGVEDVVDVLSEDVVDEDEEELLSEALLSEELVLLSDLDDALLLGELYRSAYQPLPFRMKPVPREICLRAVSPWQLGHSLRGSSRIDCSVSHS
jgi:hypothetical protein